MDELEDIRAAIADLDRQQRKLMNAHKHRLRMVERYTEEARIFQKRLDVVQERWLALIADERRLTGDTDA